MNLNQEMNKKLNQMYKDKPIMNTETYNRWLSNNDAAEDEEFVLFRKQVKSLQLTYDMVEKLIESDDLDPNYEKNLYQDCGGKIDNVAQIMLIDIADHLAYLLSKQFIFIEEGHELNALHF